MGKSQVDHHTSLRKGALLEIQPNLVVLKVLSILMTNPTSVLKA